VIESVSEAQGWLLALILTLPRILAVFIVLPFLSEPVLPGMIRNGIAVVLATFMVPVVASQLDTVPLDAIVIIAIIGKEMIIGLLIGFLVSLVFWAIGSMGYFIDFQRGAMSASLFAPMFGEQTSPLGAFFAQMMATLLFAGGGFLLLLDALFTSYVTWPVSSFYPNFNWAATDFFLKQFDWLMYNIILLAGPIVMTMFLAELGMALIGRYVPQINVFILAMPLKSAIALLMLALYTGFIVEYIQGDLHRFSEVIQSLDTLLR